jgi:hypothetical protein
MPIKVQQSNGSVVEVSLKQKRRTPSPSREAMQKQNAQGWYRIPEIPIEKFVICVKDIYKVIEETHKSKSSLDTFIKAVLTGHANMTEAAWDKAEKVRLSQKALEMKMGDFHEELMGKFPGYITFPNGHVTGCDVGKSDLSELFEVKNRDNTIKGSDGKHVVAMLKEHADKGRLAVLVQINCPNGKVNRFGADATVKVWNGSQVYEYLSGRASFFDDLEITVKYVFANFKTYDSLKQSLGIA